MRSNTLNTFKYAKIRSNALRYAPIHQIRSDAFKYVQIRSSTLKYTTIHSSTPDTLRYAQIQLNTFKYGQIRSHTLQIHSTALRYAQMRSDTLRYTQIRLDTFKYGRIHSNIVKCVQILSNTQTTLRCVQICQIRTNNA